MPGSDKSDVLSEVFSALRIRSEIYFRAALGEGAAVLVPPEKRRVRFHLVLQGQCWVGTGGSAPIQLSEGDIVLIPNGASQVVSADRDAKPMALQDAIRGGGLRDGVLRGGDGALRAMLLCGFCRFDESIDHPVLANLPPVIHLCLSDLDAEPWLAATLKLLALEAGLDAQGTTAVVGRLIEVVVIQATRRLAAAQLGNGFIFALSDAGLSRALRAIHRMPEKAWSVGDLAGQAGMSRARFADRFTETVGMPPIEYLTRWRLMKARALLADTALSIDSIAEQCGYASLPSFSRRFKNQFGVGPGAFRRSQRGLAPGRD
ncbi:MAG TPA: AraC family transcriptional regulator [Ferrovibrio sp.]|jgi:AraC-like DNA-binding protein|uniref:AraC family transcriptional regulator n=1 Tax=Ferrovibrio sp. TaxID=1917215 RepID=UPI002ED56D08